VSVTPPRHTESVTKRCPACGRWKAYDQFPRNRRTKDGFATYCKPCHNEKGRASRIRHHGSTRHYHLQARYGISAIDAERMLDEQGGRCAICRRQPAVHVDHDHVTGAVRRLLCFNCNGGLGQFHDDPDLIRRAAAYLDAHDPEAEERHRRTRERLTALRN
jgi:hypothetical protein